MSTIQNAIWALPSITVTHGGVVRTYTQPCSLFRPYRFIVDPICVPFYFVEEMLFQNYILIDNPVSAVCFPPLPPNFKELSIEDQTAIQVCLNKITFPTIGPAQRLTLTVRHRSMCPWHSDCNGIAGMAEECKAPPFSAFFQGTSQY